MDADTVFRIANTSVLPAWLLLAVAPRWKLSTELIVPVVFPLTLAVLYAYLIVSGLLVGGDGADFSTLAGVKALFTEDWGVVTGWVHYLVFDLFIGAWEVRDSQRHRIPHLAVVPCLFFTLMLGPVGLLMYFALRVGWTRQVRVTIEAPALE